MKQEYKIYSNCDGSLTKEILDNIEVGDYVKCNDWTKPFIVVAVSKNYFIMVRKHFDTYEYSVCEKLPARFTRNYKYEGNFSIGPDNYHTYYNYTNLKECEEALIRFEDGYTYTPLAEENEHPNYYEWEKTANPISIEKGHLEHGRQTVSLLGIQIKKTKWNKNNIQKYLDEHFKGKE